MILCRRAGPVPFSGEKTTVKHTITLTVALAMAWMLLSGHTEMLLLAFGAGSVALVVFISRRMALVDHEGYPVHLHRRLLSYWPWLIWQIVLSSVDVALRALGPRSWVDPRVIRVKASQRSDVGRVIHANSITLTPGTVSLAVYDDYIEVHAIAPAVADDMASGAMDRRIPDAGAPE